MTRTVLAAALLGLCPALAGAQVVDSLSRVDSLRADTTDYTALFLRSQQEARRPAPAPPRIGAGTLLPGGSRMIFDRDSIIWSGAETVSELLTRVPGVFLLRGGWLGRPELPNYQAHGPASVEYLVDGIPYLPIAGDTVMVDPSLLPLSMIDRMEIERLPARSGSGSLPIETTGSPPTAGSASPAVTSESSGTRASSRSAVCGGPDWRWRSTISASRWKWWWGIHQYPGDHPAQLRSLTHRGVRGAILANEPQPGGRISTRAPATP